MTLPKPTDKEIFIHTDDKMMVKADKAGVIEYANFKFIDIFEYNMEDVLGKDIGFLTHPDMPETIFNHVWENIFQKKKAFAILKNISKTGSYCWLQATFDFKVNENTQEIEYIYASFSRASKTANKDLGVLYTKLKKIETESGIDIAESYLKGFLDNKSTDFNSFIESYINK